MRAWTQLQCGDREPPTKYEPSIIKHNLAKGSTFPLSKHPRFGEDLVTVDARTLHAFTQPEISEESTHNERCALRYNGTQRSLWNRPSSNKKCLTPNTL
jgi:hypothetical protein